MEVAVVALVGIPVVLFVVELVVELDADSDYYSTKNLGDFFTPDCS